MTIKAYQYHISFVSFVPYWTKAAKAQLEVVRPLHFWRCITVKDILRELIRSYSTTSYCVQFISAYVLTKRTISVQLFFPESSFATACHCLMLALNSPTKPSKTSPSDISWLIRFQLTTVNHPDIQGTCWAHPFLPAFANCLKHSYSRLSLRQCADVLQMMVDNCNDWGFLPN